MNQFTGLQKALRAVGSVAKLSVALGVNQKTLLLWLKQDGVEAPPETRVENTGIRRASDLAGGPTLLGRALGVSRQVVGIWIRQGYVPMHRAQEIENTYGVPRIELVSAKVRNAMGAGGEL